MSFFYKITENMKPEIRKLLEISTYYGNDKEYVIAGGGNTSFKDEQTIWIKASGYSLAGLDEEDLVTLSRERLKIISQKKYSDDEIAREDQVKSDLFSSIVSDSGNNKRPSVETSLHELIQYKFVVHLHPALINGILCSRNARNLTLQLFGEKAMFIQYTNPGYTLFKKLESEIKAYRERHSMDPKIIFLENHGSFVSADSTEEIKSIYENIISVFKSIIQPLPEIIPLPYNPVLNKVLPAIRMMLSEENPRIIRFRSNTLIAHYYQNHQEFHRISLPLTPDMIVYCKARYMYIDQTSTAGKILDSFRQQLPRFLNEYGYPPKILIIKNIGVFAIDDSVASAEIVLDVYEDLIKTSYYSSFCGGTKFLSPEQVAFIDQWEVENYRRKVIQKRKPDNKLNNKIAVITGGAQG
ncbi:MAG TPA: hypothetical protein DDW27_08820, partial [Bacteroidales bacterium]|nr:hypothetical protein [Bacteroidales bacterium]